MITPLISWYAMPRGTGSILPGWYTEYYSQEDRLKAIAASLGRMQAWDELALGKINELTDAVNSLEARVKNLEA